MIIFSMEFLRFKRIGKFEPYTGKEDNFQISVARYLDALGVLWFHVPNGGHRNKVTGAILKAMGVKPGVSDCLILEARKGFAGFAIELKVGRNDTSDNQKAFIENLQKRNWRVLVSWSLDEVIAEVDEYFS